MEEVSVGCMSWSFFSAAYTFGLIHVTSGAAGIMLAGIFLSYSPPSRDNYSATKLLPQDEFNQESKHIRILYLLLVCSAIEFLLGFLLFGAEYLESILLCRAYVAISLVTCPFTILFLLRLFPIFMVGKFANKIHRRRQSILPISVELRRPDHNFTDTVPERAVSAGPFLLLPGISNLPTATGPQRRSSLPSYLHCMTFSEVPPDEEIRPPSYQDAMDSRSASMTDLDTDESRQF